MKNARNSSRVVCREKRSNKNCGKTAKFPMIVNRINVFVSFQFSVCVTFSFVFLPMVDFNLVNFATKQWNVVDENDERVDEFV